MPTPRKVNNRMRQPLCPYCHYNLIATVDPTMPRFVRCPECGEEIEPHEFVYKRKPGEWTDLIGLRNAVISILVRALIIAALWALLLLAMDAMLSTILGSTGVRIRRMMLIPLTLSGIVTAWIMTTRLNNHAGFESWLVTWLAVGGCWLGLHLGHALANSLFTLNFLSASGWSIMVGVVALCMTVYLMYRDS